MSPEEQEIIKLAPELTEALTKLANGEVPFKYLGICGNLAHMIDFHNVYNFVSQYSRGWEYRTNDWSYPVPGGDYFGSNRNLWARQEGEYRYSLCRYLLKRIEILVSSEER
jgi:hypothetical protein